MRQLTRFTTTLCLAVAASLALADDIPVEPGEGTISKLARRASAGDVLVLAPGEYTDEVRLPNGVSIRGAGADQTTLITTAYAAISIDEWKGSTVSGLTIRGGEGTTRGIAATGPVRVERVRFVEISEAVALRESALSDVIYCEFLDCGIGVRAIGGSSPTVYGCVFDGGRMGVFNMDGAAYVRNNVFRGLSEGMRIFSGDQPIVRNNLFLDCADAAIYLGPRDKGVFTPSIRNNVFVGCPTVVLAEDIDLLDTFSHAVVDQPSDAMFKDKDSRTLEFEAPILKTADPGVTLGENYALAFADRAALDDGALRLCSQPADAAGCFGPEPQVTAFGTNAPELDQTPPNRFVGPTYIANCIPEEYLALRTLRLRNNGQSLQNGPEGARDVFETQKGERAFDISRFYGEMGIGF